MASALALRLLGGFELRDESGAVVQFARPRRKAQALLAYLACHRGQPHLREKLAALLWPDMESEEARANLRQALSALRGAVPAGLQIDQDAVTLMPDAMHVDALVFEQCARAATLPSLLEAGDLYHGDFLAGLDVGETPFEEWLVVERERLRDLAIEALAQTTSLLRQAGDREAAVATARRLLALDPLQEPVHRTVMRLYSELGRRDAALRQYQVCIDVLRHELDTEPEEDTRRLYQDILRARSTAGTAVASGQVVVDEPAMIGRTTELESLIGAVDQACRGAGQVVVVLGEAGIGKSRLVREMTVRAADRGALVMTGHAYPGAQGLPYASWVEAMRSERLTEDREIGKQLGPIWTGELARLLPELGPAAEGPVAHLRLFESVVRFLGCAAASRPIVVVLEDLHWADEMSVRLLVMASRRLRSMPVLVVATARDDDPEPGEPLRDLLRHETVTWLGLGPLSRPETTALVRALAARRPDVAVTELADRVWEGCAGNPFVAVETIRALGQTTVIEARRALPVPERVQELVRARLERLGDAGQRLVAVAAVIGRDFTFDLLRHAAGVSVESAVDGLEELVRRRVLRAAGERFDFVHDRIREVVAGGLLQPRRRLLHRHVAEAIESLHADDVAPHAAALGRHCFEGEVWPRAIAYLRQAATRAFAHAAFRDAVPYFEHAMVALDRLPVAERRIEDAVDMRLEFAGCLAILAELDRGDLILREALAAAEASGDRERLRRVLEFRGNHHWWMAEYDRAERVFAQARSLAPPGHELAERELWNRAVNRYAMGEYRAALDLLDRAAPRDSEAAPRSASPGAPASALRLTSVTFFRVCSLVELGEFDEAIDWAERDFHLAQTLPHAYRLAHAASARGFVHVRRGEADAIGPLEHAFTHTVESNFRAAWPRIATWLGLAYAVANRAPEALSMLESVQRVVPMLRGACSAVMAEAYVHLGRIDEAAALTEQMLAWTAQRGERGTHAWALWLAAEICTRRLLQAADDTGVSEAEARYRDALARAGDLEMRPLVARCQLGLGSLPGSGGRRAQRREHLEAARLMFSEMGMRSWRERADALLVSTASA